MTDRFYSQWHRRARWLELDLVVVGHFELVRNIILTIISLFTAGTMTGFDASGHVVEETKNAR
jgi:hypothetical protein